MINDEELSIYEKKLLILISFLILTNLYSKGYDFSVGGSYRLGFHYSYYYLSGFHEMLTIPIIFSYYPTDYPYFSLGFKNKIGYGFTIYHNVKRFYFDTFDATVTYDRYPLEHEIYDNISFLMKFGGEYCKFLLGLGCGMKYTFINIPNGSFNVSFTTEEDSCIDFYAISSGDYNFFSMGPSFDLSLEVINKPKSFSFIVSTPFEFLIPFSKLKFINIYSEVRGYYLYLLSRYREYDYFNFSFGIEFMFSFYTFKESK